jgi:malate synthase
VEPLPEAPKSIPRVPSPEHRRVHSPGKFTYAGLKSYLRLALYYTASFIHGTGCIALDGVFEDLATVRRSIFECMTSLAGFCLDA